MADVSDMIAGGYYASTALFGLGGLVFALATRERLYAYFALHALAVGALALTFPPIAPVADAIEPWHVACRMVAEGLVVATIGLGLRPTLAVRLSGWLRWGIRAVFPVGMIASASSIWFMFNTHAYGIYGLAMLAVVATIVAGLVVGMVRSYRQVIWIAIALTPLLVVGATAATMEGFSLGSMQYYAEGILAGFAFELVCGSFILAVHFSRTLNERDTAQAEAIAARIASEIDPLTGIANRRAFDAELRNRPYERFAALAIIDCDHFKLVNDRFGHATGDAVLQVIADCLAWVPGNAMRIGGEEFAIFLNTSDWQRELESLRQAIACQARRAIDRSPLQQPITVSIGAVKLLPDLTAKTALMLADEALYRAKHNGRNRLEIHERIPDVGSADQRVAVAA